MDTVLPFGAAIMTGTMFNKTCVSLIDKLADDMGIGSSLFELALAFRLVFTPLGLAGWGGGWRLVTLTVGLLVVGWVRTTPILNFISMQKTKVSPWAF